MHSPVGARSNRLEPRAVTRRRANVPQSRTIDDRPPFLSGRCHESASYSVWSTPTPTMASARGRKDQIMKLVIIGGTGLIGSKVVTQLRQGGYEVVAASPNSGVNTLTGEGLSEACKGASVAVDLSNSPSFEDAAVMKFFQTSTRNLLAAEA